MQKRCEEKEKWSLPRLPGILFFREMDSPDKSGFQEQLSQTRLGWESGHRSSPACPASNSV